jgi:hypothetical protein
VVEAAAVAPVEAVLPAVVHPLEAIPQEVKHFQETLLSLQHWLPITIRTIAKLLTPSSTIKRSHHSRRNLICLLQT